jgi:segregation and condensation protein A
LSQEQLVGPVVYGLHVPEQQPASPDTDGSAPEPPVTDAPAPAAEADGGGFTVRLTNFTGPFDLLLQLIGKHKLDVTEIALHRVTDDFIAYIRAMGDDWDLGETSEFLLVAATLLDLKAARLLPAAEVEDEEDLALLEARDLLFARLLQYKAYKEAAAVIAELEGEGARRWPRAVTLEPRYAEALPDLVLGIGAERLLKLALKQFLPKPGPPEVSIAHIHQVRVSVREHAALIQERLRRAGSATFTLLIADCETTLEVVARFLALLELYREGLVDFEQPVSLEEMTIRWIGGDRADGDLEIDDYEGTPPEPDTAATDPEEPEENHPPAPDDDLPDVAEPSGVEAVGSGDAGGFAGVAEPSGVGVVGSGDAGGFAGVAEPSGVGVVGSGDAGDFAGVAEPSGVEVVGPGDGGGFPGVAEPSGVEAVGSGGGGDFAGVAEPSGVEVVGSGDGGGFAGVAEPSGVGVVGSGDGADFPGVAEPLGAVAVEPDGAASQGPATEADAVTSDSPDQNPTGRRDAEPESTEYDDGGGGNEVTVIDGAEPRHAEPGAVAQQAAATVSTDEEQR